MKSQDFDVYLNWNRRVFGQKKNNYCRVRGMRHQAQCPSDKIALRAERWGGYKGQVQIVHGGWRILRHFDKSGNELFFHWS